MLETPEDLRETRTSPLKSSTANLKGPCYLCKHGLKKAGASEALRRVSVNLVNVSGLTSAMFGVWLVRGSDLTGLSSKAEDV